MYLWHFANPELTQAVILGRDARADALSGAAYATLRGSHEAAIALTGGIAALFRQAAKRYRQRRAARATIDELRALNDRLLSDIGLHRGEIRSLVTERYRNDDAAPSERRRAADRRRSPVLHAPDRADDSLPLAA